MLPDPSASRRITSLIEDHREANATLGALDPMAQDQRPAFVAAEQRAAILLCSRAADPDIGADDHDHYVDYITVYGQDDRHKMSLTWASDLPADVLHTLRQHYRPEASNVAH